MKKTKYNLFGLILALLAFIGCAEEPELTVLSNVVFSDPITVSSNDLVLVEEDSSSTALTVNWEAVDFLREATVTYSVQITTVDDTSQWANAWEKTIGDEVLSTSFIVKELNQMAINNFEIEAGAQGKFAFRIKAYVDRYVFSQPQVVNITTYEETVMNPEYPALYIAGDFQGWNIGEPSTIVSTEDNGIYEGYIFIPAGGTNEFKVYTAPDWGSTSYGTKNDGVIFEANYAGDNFAAPSDGYYLFSINLNDMTYLLMKTDWGILGAATPGGWDTDTELTYDPDSQTWSATADMVADGSFKFRANKAWALDFGIDAEGNLAYANHPWKAYVDQPQLTVPSDGNYTITLDLHVPGAYTYELKKN